MREEPPVRSAVVPVAGLGTRLLPATRSQPKEMLPVLDKPVVQYVAEELAAGGVTRVLFVTGRRKRAIEDHFDVDPELNGSEVPGSALEIHYTRQPRPLGLGDALARGASFAAGGPVAVALGDSIIEEPVAGGLLRRLIAAFAAAGPDACAAIAVAGVPDARVSSYGIVVPADSGKLAGGIDPQSSPSAPFAVADVVEKPDPASVASRWAVMGRYVLGPTVLAQLACTGADGSGEVQLADAVRARIAAGEAVVAVPLHHEERRHDIGTPEGYAEVFLRYALRDPRFGAELRAVAAALLSGGR